MGEGGNFEEKKGERVCKVEDDVRLCGHQGNKLQHSACEVTNFFKVEENFTALWITGQH